MIDIPKSLYIYCTQEEYDKHFPKEDETKSEENDDNKNLHETTIE